MLLTDAGIDIDIKPERLVGFDINLGGQPGG